MDDTPREIRRMQVAGYHALPTAKRVEIWAGLVKMTRQMTWQGIKQRHPDEDETKWRRRYAGLMVGEELATKFFGAVGGRVTTDPLTTLLAVTGDLSF